MVTHPFIPRYLVSREADLQRIGRILAEDRDLLLVGVPGVGRRTLLRSASQQVGAKMLEIDCLRTTSASRFLRLLADSIIEGFTAAPERMLIQRWSTHQPIVLEQAFEPTAKLVWHSTPAKEWDLFQALLSLPQWLAEQLDCRVVIALQNFPHIRSWDRSGKWEAYLRQEVQRQSRVSYALVAITVEPWVEDSTLQVIALAPLEDEDLKTWLVPTMASEGLYFDPESHALDLFLDSVQGHLGDAIALARRIWLDYWALPHLSPLPAQPSGLIQAHHVHRSLLTLVEDLSLTFESLILLLPPSQVRVLESLALDPTDKPQSRDYIEKHQLSRGGGLQGALSSLEHKGLVYGPKYGYRVAMPFLAFWLRQRLA
jgi:hypothetical protein